MKSGSRFQPVQKKEWQNGVQVDPLEYLKTFDETLMVDSTQYFDERMNTDSSNFTTQGNIYNVLQRSVSETQRVDTNSKWVRVGLDTSVGHIEPKNGSFQKVFGYKVKKVFFVYLTLFYVT